MKTPIGILSDKLSHFEVVSLQNYIDGVYRLIVFIYLLSMSVLHFSHEHVSIVIITSLMIILSLMYGFYITYEIGAILLKHEGYNAFNIVFYWLQTIFLLVMYCILMYFYYFPLKNTNKHFISTTKDDDIAYDISI